MLMRTLESSTGAQIVLDGRAIINFAGSPYLGVGRHAELV
jgi:hypothetical protein